LIKEKVQVIPRFDVLLYVHVHLKQIEFEAFEFEANTSFTFHLKQV